MNEYIALGRIMPLHRGTYDAAASYEVNDIVSFGGQTYWHAATETTTGTPPTDSTIWQPLLSDAIMDRITAIETRLSQLEQGGS